MGAKTESGPTHPVIFYPAVSYGLKSTQCADGALPAKINCNSFSTRDHAFLAGSIYYYVVVHFLIFYILHIPLSKANRGACQMTRIFNFLTAVNFLSHFPDLILIFPLKYGIEQKEFSKAEKLDIFLAKSVNVDGMKYACTWKCKFDIFQTIISIF